MHLKSFIPPVLLLLLLASCNKQPRQEATASQPAPAPTLKTEPVAIQAAPITLQELNEAALYGKKETVEAAIAQDFDLNQTDTDQRTPLMFASFNARTELAKQMISAGANVNAQDATGTTALMFAASAPDGTETVKVLLDAGADINTVDNNEHFSALMWAAAEGQLKSVKLLLEKGADPTLQDIDGDSAQSFAAKAGHTAIAELLATAVKE